MEWLTSRWNCSKETVVDIIHEQYVQTDVQAKYANESVQRALHRNVPSINPALLDPQPEPPPQDVEEDQASYDQDWKCSQKSLLWRPQPDEYLGGQDPHADSQTVDPLVDNLGQQLQIEYPLGQLITDSNAIFSGSGSEPYTGFSEMLQPEIVETPSRQVGISGIEMGLSGANPYTNPSGPFTSIPSRYGLSLSSTVQGAATPINALSSPPAHHQYFEQCPSAFSYIALQPSTLPRLELVRDTSTTSLPQKRYSRYPGLNTAPLVVHDPHSAQWATFP